MSKLSPQAREFVEAFVDVRSYKVAGAAAGMTGTQAWNLAQTEPVQEAILELARKTMRTGIVASTKLLTETVEDEAVARKDRLKAALAILDRGGLPAVSRMEGGGVVVPLADAALVGFAGALLERLARPRERVIEAAQAEGITEI